MLNRRQLRIKVLHALYAYFQEDDKDLPKSERQLFFSIEKFHELYIYLLSMMERLHFLRKEKLDLQTKRIMGTVEDKNPNRRFIENPIFLELEANQELEANCQKYKIQWDEDTMDIIRDIHQKTIKTEAYSLYMDEDSGPIEAEVKIVSDIFKQCVANNDLVQHFLDERSIFWADDLDLAASMALRTLKAFKNTSKLGEGQLLSLYKEPEEEKEFVRELFRKTILQSNENELYIDSATKNWDLERIAYMDMVLMKMALAEARTFKSIPTKVTMNEYIELSKYYSTPKSSTFINGVLDKLFDELKEQGEIKKMGRGLFES
ncbi:MAG: transcription antitermination factor NusB [Flavobacteriales bacterium]|nr:transcription antitermination factor NusB [Flavobacteriales bacterium]